MLIRSLLAVTVTRRPWGNSAQDNSNQTTRHDSEYGMEYQVRFSKWNTYSKDTQFKLPYDCVMTVSNPEDNLEQSYKNKIRQKQELENDAN